MRAAWEEQRWATTEQPMDDDCCAELIDGTWTYCGCPECDQSEYDDIESQVESGSLTEAEALELHRWNGA